jgi:hypothetical protein
MVALLITSYVCGVLAFVHGFSRPASQWVGADRNRGFWLGTIATVTVFGLGLIAALAYIIGVLPHYANDANTAFLKG